VGERWVVVGLGLGIAACGPTSDRTRRTCDGDEPVQLVSSSEPRFRGDARVANAAIVDDRVAVTFWESDERGNERWHSLAVDACGGESVELFEVAAQWRRMLGSAGAWMVAVDTETDDVHWIDPRASAPSHPLFTDMRGCLVEVAGGLVAVDAEGVLSFREDPADPSSPTRELARGVLAPRYASAFGDDLRACFGGDGDLPVRDGDGVLVAYADGTLVRIALPSGTEETLIDGAVGQFVVLDDSRYVAWRGPSLHSDDACCELNVLERSTGASFWIDGGTLPGDLDWSGRWASTFSFEFDGTSTQRYVDVVTQARFEIDDWWNLEAALSDGRMLISPVGDDASGTAILDPASRIPEPLEFPPPGWDQPEYDDGIVGLELAPDAWSGRLMRLSWDGRTIDVLGEGVAQDYLRTQRGTVVFIDRPEFGVPGRLTRIDVDGDREVIADDVELFVVPYHGSDRELEEVLFSVRHPDRGGLWRYVLP